MPYSQEHKEKTKRNILNSAQALFSLKGFNAVTVNNVMESCSMTRGAFYAHFKSKADLYKESLRFSAMNSELAKPKDNQVSSKQWLSKLLDVYLSFKHVNGEQPCPLAFLATDIVSRDGATRETYTETYKNMNEVILSYAGTNSLCNKDSIFSLTSMIIGAVAIARTTDDEGLIKNILTSCKQQATLMLKEL